MKDSATVYNHEEFDIKEEKVNQRIKVIRQERVSASEEPFFLEINNVSYKILDYSLFGVAIESQEKIGTDFETHEAHFIYDNVDLGAYHVRVTRSQPMGDQFLVAFEIIGEPLNLEQLRAIKESLQIIQEQEDYVQDLQQVPPEIKATVYEFYDWMHHLEKKINALEKHQNKSDMKSMSDFESAVVAVFSDYFARTLPKNLEALEKELNKLNEAGQKVSIQFLREQLKDTIYQSPFSHRVFYKPLGYAGDYEMMNLIYKNEAVGESLFQKCLHKYYVEEPAAQAVRNRVKYFGRQIKERFDLNPGKTLSFLSVACGPAMEWQEFIKNTPDLEKYTADVYLLDQDKEALLNAQKQLKHLSAKYKNNIKFHFVNKAIKNLIVEGIRENVKFDLIYSSGLFDYLTTPVAQMTAQKLHEELKPGGELIIGNFNTTNPDTSLMTLILDWHLIYRTPE
ncbi:MAG: class I SAM-dependent methyltransferase, partial [Bdellovibrio sp.]